METKLAAWESLQDELEALDEFLQDSDEMKVIDLDGSDQTIHVFCNSVSIMQQYCKVNISKLKLTRNLQSKRTNGNDGATKHD